MRGMRATSTEVVLIVVGDASATEHEIAEGTLSLRKEIDGLCEEVRPLGTTPRTPGSKAVDPLTLGALAAIIAPTALPALVNLVKAWVGRRQAQRVKLKITHGDESTSIEYDPTTMSLEQVDSLVNQLRRPPQTLAARE